MNHFLIISVFLLAFSKGEETSTQWAIKFEPNYDINQFATTHGLVYEGTVGILEDYHLFRMRDTHKRNVQFTQFVQFLQEVDVNNHPVQWYEEQILKKREKRVNITDPLFPKQWHLHGKENTHINVLPVWEQGYFGEGVRIAIVDDGIQTTHPDVSKGVKKDSSYNFNLGKIDPNPTYLDGPNGDWHGTASAGAAAARDDGLSCGVGVAPHAELAGIAILQNNADVSDNIEAQALSYKFDQNHIYSNSWGPIQPGYGEHKNEKPGTLVEAAVKRAIKEGRSGLGSIYVWAAGNDGRNQDNCNYDGYANMRYAIMVGSTEDTGARPAYSEPCAALAAVAPGGTITPKAKIQTTDLLSSKGVSGGDCTEFAGTSASCPMAAGLVALILQVNPKLSWLDVQYIIAQGTTKHIEDRDWQQNAAGQWVSHNYGWGLLNAFLTIEAAKKWGNRTIIERDITFQNNTPVAIINGKGVSTILVKPEDNMKVHHVEVIVWTSNSDVSGTKIVLTSPSGTYAILAEKHKDTKSKWDGWKFLSRMHWGEQILGSWNLTVESDETNKVIERWTIMFYGDKDTWHPLTQNESAPAQGTPESADNTSPAPDMIQLNEPAFSLEDEFFDSTPLIPLTTTSWNLSENSVTAIIISAFIIAVILGVTLLIFSRCYESQPGVNAGEVIDLVN